MAGTRRPARAHRGAPGHPLGVAALLVVAACAALSPGGRATADPTPGPLGPAPAAQIPDDRLTLDLYLQWHWVSDPRISPDGTRIVYTRTWIDTVNDTRKSALWIMDADGSRNRYLVEGSSPRWSPDGTRIAYLAEGEPGGTQIFVRWMDAEGATSQVTHVTERPSDTAWSPDGRWIAFRMPVPEEKEAWTIPLPRRPKGAKWTAPPRIVERSLYRRDRIGYLDDGRRHIFLVPADGGPVRQISKGDYDFGGLPGFFRDGGLQWSPDGRTIYFSGLLVEDAEYRWRETEIYALDVDTGEARPLTTRHGPDTGPVVSPDGGMIAYTGYDWTDQTYIERQLYVMGADGSNPRSLTPGLDRSPRNLMWAADGSGVYFTVNDRGTRNLYFASLDGSVRQVTTGVHILTVTDMSRDGVAVGTRTSFHDPPDIVRLEVRGASAGPITELTDVNGNLLRGRVLGEVEEIWYASVDDLRIQGWIIKPPDFDPARRYPLILTIHGGPHAMYGVGFNFAWQNHAAHDYVVLYTNPRGSSGYGTAFGNEINRAYPGKDFDDLMRGVDEVVARGYIDERNMYVYGCSGGGVLTAWVVGHTDRFAAASSNCPVIDWLSFVGTTDGISWYRNFEALPWEDPSEHLRRSPLMYVGNVKTPTLLMTGVNDLRTPISQTEEFYAALKVLRVPTAMIRFNGEWHGTTRKPSNFLRTQLYLRHWFERYMTEDAAPKVLKREAPTRARHGRPQEAGPDASRRRGQGPAPPADAAREAR